MLREDVASYEKDRGVSLAGPAAAAWMDKRGYELGARGVSSRVAGDAIQSPEFAVIRLWHNAPSITRAPTDGGLVVGFFLEGNVRMDIDGKALTLKAPEGYVYRSAWAMRETGAGATAFIEAHLSAEAMLRIGVSVAEGLFKLGAELSSSRIFSSAVSAMLNARVTPHFSQWHDVQKTVEFALRAVLGEANIPGGEGLVSRLSRLHERAIAQIDRRHSDPQFSVSLLAEEVGISQSRLHAAFADAGSTPSIEIRKARLTFAKTLLALEKNPSPVRRAEIAKAAGFRSVKAMKRAQLSPTRLTDGGGVPNE